MVKKLGISLPLIVLFIMILVSPVFTEEDPFLKEEEPALAEDFTVDWGLLFDVYILDSNSTTENFSVINDTRLYFNFIFSEDTFLFIRGRNYFQWTPNTSPTLGRDKVENVIDLEQAFFQTQGKNVRFAIGRKYYRLGLGILFNNIADGSSILFKTGGWSVEVLANYTGFIKKDFDTFKQSINDFNNGSDRLFFGAKTSYSFESNQTFYISLLHQRDLQKTSALNFDEYQSFYALLGWENELAKGFYFMGEFIYEFGSSPIATTGVSNATGTISAYALDMRFRYYAGTKARLAFLLQYARASGDSDRTNSTLGRGNTSGKDTGFKAFGQYYTGFSFRPLFSNIQMIRFAADGNPLFFWNTFKRFYGSLQYTAYMKTNKNGVTSDIDITNDKLFIGQSIDFFGNWRIASDLSYIFKMGIMFKGSAFGTSTPIGLIFTGFQLQL